MVHNFTNNIQVILENIVNIECWQTCIYKILCSFCSLVDSHNNTNILCCFLLEPSFFFCYSVNMKSRLLVFAVFSFNFLLFFCMSMQFVCRVVKLSTESGIWLKVCRLKPETENKQSLNEKTRTQEKKLTSQRAHTYIFAKKETSK